jgi:hypothetical protein
MKRNRLFLQFIAIILLCMPFRVSSQVLINNGGGTADPSSMLEVRSTDKGLLLPRIDFNDRPTSPAPGLLIFVTAHGPYGNNSLYLYNGIAWIRLMSSTVSPGDFVAGGVAFYVDSTGQHGYVAAIYDQSADMDWGCNTTLVGPGAQHWDFGTGQLNTTAIINSCSQSVFAAKICDTLTTGGFTDWFLPSIDELDSMYVRQTLIPNLNSWWYWSSTEADATGAMFMDFQWPLAYWSTDKAALCNVRCIRKF